jgi:GTP-binding protein
MAENQNFVDYVKIYCKTGKGGAGSSHFRREKYVPLGGPDGGDGGRGGHIILQGNAQLWTLLHLKYKKHVKSDEGKGGEGGLRTGKSGKDIFLQVPLGTVARDGETNEILFEITNDQEERIMMRGGMGGQGNHQFKTATNQAPTYAQPGTPGEEKTIILELKVLADVGLVGFPNAGKSTLLASVSAARPEIGDYPFTTLTPNLGIVSYYDNKSFIMADIPGIIEGAHLGKGLGYRFLRHIERNSILLFLIPADSNDIKKDFEILLHELKMYNPELLTKERVLAISKSDMLDEELMKLMKKTLPKKIDVVFISAVSGLNLNQLKEILWEKMNK